jgi:hypothetical protein
VSLGHDQEDVVEKIHRGLQILQAHYDCWAKYRNDLLALNAKLGLGPPGNPDISIADLERTIGSFLILRELGGKPAKRRGRPLGILNKGLARSDDNKTLYKRRERARKKFEADYDKPYEAKAKAQELLRTAPRLSPFDQLLMEFVKTLQTTESWPTRDK